MSCLLLYSFAKEFPRAIGFDFNQKKVKALKQGTITEKIAPNELKNSPQKNT